MVTPAPMMQRGPIVTPSRMVAFAPTKTHFAYRDASGDDGLTGNEAMIADDRMVPDMVPRPDNDVIANRDPRPNYVALEHEQLSPIS